MNFMLAVGVGAVLLAAGCTRPTPPKTPKTTDANSTSDGLTTPDTEVELKKTLGGVLPAETDQLNLYYANDPDTLNVIVGNDTVSEDFQRWVYESLGERDFHDPDKWDPSLAESWEFDEKALEYTIHLRKGVRWHPMKLPDGRDLPSEEVDADDVLFTFQCILNPNVEAAHTRSYYLDPDAKTEEDKIKIELTRVDDQTLKVRWKKPYFMSDEFTLAIPIIPEHVYSVDENGEPIAFDYGSQEFANGFNGHWANSSMCGTGPLRFEKWEKNERLSLVRNPDHWGAPFYFSGVLFRCIPNVNTSVEMMLTNDLDWAVVPEKDRYIKLSEEEAVKEKRVTLAAYDYPGYRYIGWNNKRPFLKDKRVRWALSHAVPVDQIIDKVYHDLAIRVTGPFQPGSSSNDPNLAPVPLDLDKAKSLLEEAGWKDTDQDGIRDGVVDGAPVKATIDLMIYADAPQYQVIAELMQEKLRQIGVELVITPTKWDLMLVKLRNKDFDASMLGWAMSWKQDPFQIWHSSQADLPDSSNSIGYVNLEVDKLIISLREEVHSGKQADLYQQIHRLIYEEQPYTFLFADKRTAGYHSRINEIKFYKIRPAHDAREWTTTKHRL